MRLQVRRVRNGHALAYALTDDGGQTLPGQISCVVSSGAGEAPKVTVEFIAGGVDISLKDDFAALPSGTIGEASAAFAALSPANRTRFLTMYGLVAMPAAAYPYDGQR